MQRHIAHTLAKLVNFPDSNFFIHPIFWLWMKRGLRAVKVSHICFGTQLWVGSGGCVISYSWHFGDKYGCQLSLPSPNLHANTLFFIHGWFRVCCSHLARVFWVAGVSGVVVWIQMQDNRCLKSRFIPHRQVQGQANSVQLARFTGRRQQV